MGETYDKVQAEMRRVPYKVVQGPNNTPRIDIDNKQYTPQGNLCHGAAKDEEDR